jgi:hypothetical protein
VDVPLGEVEVLCLYCGSRLKFLPGREEMEVVRTREEMKYRERVEVQKRILENELREREAERWRQMAGRVAIAALPMVGESVGRAAFHAVLGRSSGCVGCGCFTLLAILGALVFGVASLLR